MAKPLTRADAYLPGSKRASGIANMYRLGILCCVLIVATRCRDLGSLECGTRAIRVGSRNVYVHRELHGLHYDATWLSANGDRCAAYNESADALFNHSGQ